MGGNAPQLTDGVLSVSISPLSVHHGVEMYSHRNSGTLNTGWFPAGHWMGFVKCGVPGSG